MKTQKIALVGLGYVGLPLAVEFGKTGKVSVLGFDVDQKKIEELQKGVDRNKELTPEELSKASLEYTFDASRLKEADFLVVAVPTPVTEANVPDLTLMELASKTIGKNLQKGAIVVFESTVYPGVTEEICIPIIEKESGLSCGKDWKIGYSPERMNPGDKEHTLDKVIKVVSGMDAETLDEVAEVYSLVCKAGVHKAPNIKTAEASKVIENIQRDLNIALMNELSLIFDRLGIHTRDVLAAAGTKWNFQKYFPGLVGGHCIGVDPYYLTHRAEELGYHPQVILSGRRINDFMGEHIADLMIRGLIQAGKVVQGAKVLVMGLTFKENVRDIRNSKIIDTIQKLKDFGVEIFGYDPILTQEEIQQFDANPVVDMKSLKFDGVILAVSHDAFSSFTMKDIIESCHGNHNGDGRGVLVDIRGRFFSEGKAQKDILYLCL